VGELAQAAGLAVVSAVTGAADPAQAVRELLEGLAPGPEGRGEHSA
jgi:thiamine monophosphate synthase